MTYPEAVHSDAHVTLEVQTEDIWMEIACRVEPYDCLTSEQLLSTHRHHCQMKRGHLFRVRNCSNRVSVCFSIF